MFRIDTPTAAATLPAPAPAGTPGYFSGGNPTTGVPPTTVSPDWFNEVQEELMAILAAAGVAEAKGTNNQVLTALGMLFASASSQLGVGQNWVDETANRASGTTYTNTTGRPIQVLVVLPDTVSQNPTVTVVVGGVTIINALLYDQNASSASALPSFIVPPGQTYKVTWTGTSYTSGTVQWNELR